jgi:hypothetical protein
LLIKKKIKNNSKNKVLKDFKEFSIQIQNKRIRLKIKFEFIEVDLNYVIHKLLLFNEEILNQVSA